MEKPQLRQLALPKSETCNESLSKNLADKSLASLTLCSLSLQRSNFESLTLESWSFPTCSLTLLSLSQPKDRFHSLTLHSLSLATGILQSLILDSWSFAIDSLTLYNLSQERDRLQSLTLQSLSLKDKNGFEPMSFKEVSFDEGTEELDKSLAHTKMKRRAETNSFSRISLEQRMLAQEAETNSFSPRLSKRTLSFRMCLRIFLLCSFQLVCAALLLENGSFKISFSSRSLQTDQLVAAYSSNFKRSSLQPEEFAAAYFNKSFENPSFPPESLQQDELEPACLLSPTRAMQLESLQQKKLSSKSFNQLDLDVSLSFLWFSLSRCSFQFQPEGFDNSSFEQRALHCAALLYTPRISNSQLQDYQVQSFQLTGRHFSFGLVQGGASNTALHTRASIQPWHCPASTLTSLSLAFVKPFCKIALRRSTLPALTLSSLSLAITAWLNMASIRACRSRPLRRSLFTTSIPKATSMTALQTTSFRRSASAIASRRTTFRTRSSLRTTLLWFSFLFPTLLVANNELSQTVLELELAELLANKSCSLGPYDPLEQEKLWQIQLQQNNLEKNKQLSATVPDRELSQLHLPQLCLQDPASRRQLPEESLSFNVSKKELSEQDLSNISYDKFFPENFADQLAEKQLQQNLSIDQRQLQENKLTKNTFQQLSFEQPSFTKKTFNQPPLPRRA